MSTSAVVSHSFMANRWPVAELGCYTPEEQTYERAAGVNIAATQALVCCREAIVSNEVENARIPPGFLIVQPISNYWRFSLQLSYDLIQNASAAISAQASLAIE